METVIFIKKNAQDNVVIIDSYSKYDLMSITCYASFGKIKAVMSKNGCFGHGVEIKNPMVRLLDSTLKKTVYGGSR